MGKQFISTVSVKKKNMVWERMKNIIYIKQFLSGEPVKSGPNVHGSNKFISGTKLAKTVQILNSSLYRLSVRKRKGQVFMLFFPCIVYATQHCFICSPSESTVQGSNPGLLQLWHWQPDALTTRLELLLFYVDISSSFLGYIATPHWKYTRDLQYTSPNLRICCCCLNWTGYLLYSTRYRSTSEESVMLL
jgi:hypothetical protein